MTLNHVMSTSTRPATPATDRAASGTTEEVVRAVREESDERVANEAADVLYHLSVLLAGRDLSLADAERVLDERSH